MLGVNFTIHRVELFLSHLRNCENRNDRYALRTCYEGDPELLIPKSSYLSSFFENRAIFSEMETIDLHDKKHVERTAMVNI